MAAAARQRSTFGMYQVTPIYTKSRAWLHKAATVICSSSSSSCYSGELACILGFLLSRRSVYDTLDMHVVWKRAKLSEIMETGKTARYTVQLSLAQSEIVYFTHKPLSGCPPRWPYSLSPGPATAAACGGRGFLAWAAEQHERVRTCSLSAQCTLLMRNAN